MADALAAKISEIEAPVSSLDALKKQAALSEGNLASLQVLYGGNGLLARRITHWLVGSLGGSYAFLLGRSSSPFEKHLMR
ncbi:hypothetical protein Vadar_017152 [Vaccinium darrowii]|uniref:Uncharacterized protein n=1 Tax=Vaccinium darrowii TaxID=229202 RepID=A0ACB7XRZ3_9ERIC|nr:hypothetical protein Vadar_017152 [Vaccinium darrowii]